MKKRIVSAMLTALTAATAVLSACGSDPVADAVQQAQTEVQQQQQTEPADTNTGSDSTDTTTADNGGTTEVVEEDQLTFAEGTVLRMACGYNNAKTGMTFDPDVAGEGVTLADGVTYKSGDFKPTWVAVQDILGFTIEDYYTGVKDTDNFSYWEPNLSEIDMFSGSATQLQEAGAAGEVVNIAEYLDLMPNFKAFLDANPIARMTLTGSVDGDDAGAIYNSPYFDGLDDIEKMPLMRTDWVVTLLDGDGAFEAASSDMTAAPVYEPYMTASYEIQVVKPDASGVETIKNDFEAAGGNIIEQMNAAGPMSGVDAVNMLRDYIDNAYGGYYGTQRSDLFIGQNAAWDADELVALLRCVCANSATLNADGEKVAGIFSREESNNSRRADIYRLAGVLFGVRGMESRQDFLFFDSEGTLHDARSEEATYEALLRMNAMVQEGLISSDFVNATQDTASKSETYISSDLGFMSYDYNQTQTIFNEQEGKLDDDEKYMAVMIPVAIWDDGTGAKAMRFTESWRSAKSGGWAISKPGVGDDQDKLYACLKLIDYAYSPEGMILMSYGPEAFRQDDNTFDFYGTQMPHIGEQTYADLWSLAGGNYTNFARQYLGSTLSFNKSQAFEMECTTAVGKEGLANITNAIALGTISHPELEIMDNMWYTIVPTVLPTSDADNDMLKGYSSLNTSWDTNKLSDAKGPNVFINMISFGSTGADGADVSTPADAVNVVLNDWSGKQYLALKQTAWENLLDYATNNF
jgi:putative aldouronate transport system substrate-binding protein